MRIPLADFGQGQTTAPVQHTRVDSSGVTAGSAAIARMGETVQNVALQQINQRAQEDDALVRAKASSALLDHEIEVKTRAQEIDRQVREGQLDYNEALERFETAADEIPETQLEGLPPAVALAMQTGMRRQRFGGRSMVDDTVQTARRADTKGQVLTQLDMFGKLNGMPGADTEAINARVRALGPLVAAAGLDLKVLQDAQDRNWTTQVQQRVIAAQGDMATLRAIEHDLTDAKGYYADKLDPEKRTMTWRAVQGDISQLETRQQHAEDKRLAGAEKEVGWFADQVVVGRPITAERWQEGAAAVRGTPSAAKFLALAEQSDEILKVRQMPFADQQAYVQRLSTTAATTASDDPKRDRTRLDTLQRTLDEGRKLAATSPLTFYENQTGQTVEPLNIAGAMSSGQAGVGVITDQLQQRFATLAGLRRQYGMQVAMNPWLPQEAEAFRASLAQLDDRQKLQVLSLVAGAAPDAKAYAGALAPLASDQRPALLAGLAQYKGLRSVAGVEVAPTILAGARILADKSVPMPGEAKLRAAFEERIGDALPDGSRARQDAYIVFKTLYAGMAADGGVRHEGAQPETDDRLADSALNVATGGVSDIGGHQVIRPYGMPEDDFEDRRRVEVERLARESGVGRGYLLDMTLAPVPGEEGRYYLLNGRDRQLDPKTGEPLIVRIR